MDAEPSMPALLRFAWDAYAGAVRRRLAEVGVGDLPRHGAFVLGGMANRGMSGAELVELLGISRQRASQLIDTLVLRGYLDRRPDPDDRRRTTVRLTGRGTAVAGEIRTAVRAVDDRLAGALDAQAIGTLRSGLDTLAGLRQPVPWAPGPG